MTKQWDNWGEREKDRTKRERERELAMKTGTERKKEQLYYRCGPDCSGKKLAGHASLEQPEQQRFRPVPVARDCRQTDRQTVSV